ncbi:unnamed protein product [Closterium sp. Naga37s-1]|nr:unnamed protein product [Closterium sp. Naga37s-1]
MCIRQLSLLLPLTVALIATPVCSTAGTPRRQLRKAQPAVTPNATLVLLANNTFGAKCLDGSWSATSSLLADSPSHSSALPSPPSPCPRVHTVATRRGLSGSSATRGSCRHAEQLVGAAATSAFQRLRPAQKPQTPRSLTFPLYLGPRSPPGYYFRPGAATGRLRWHIYLPGGAWCVTPADCAARAGTRLGSSKSFPANPPPRALCGAAEAAVRGHSVGQRAAEPRDVPVEPRAPHLLRWGRVRRHQGALNVSAAAAVPPNASAAANSTSPSNSTKSTKSTVHAVSSTSYCHGTSHSPLGPHFPLSLSPLLDLVRPLPSSHLYRFVSPRSSQCCLLSIPWHSNPTLPLSPRLSPCTLYLVLAALPLHILSFSPASPPCLCPSCHADLVQKRDMRSASQILLSGSSAGGQATVNLCDWLASSFPSASTRCLVDSGFFLGKPPTLKLKRYC